MGFPAAMAPQSNQRGIETADHYRAMAWGEASLNRTSVGLKHNDECALYHRAEASIEPAWD